MTAEQLSLLVHILLVTTVAGVGGTGLGGVIAALFRRDSSKTVSLLLGFAGGVMLGVVCFDLLTSALAQPTDTGIPNLWLVLIGVLTGYGVVYLLNYFIDRSTNREVAHTRKNHPETADDLDELIHADHYQHHKEAPGPRSQLFVAGAVMAAAIALHNVPEGMVIGASYASDPSGLVGAGLVMAVIIGLHNIPEGMAVAVPLISGGMGRVKAMLITALTGLPTVVGALLGYWLGTLSPAALALALSFASGAMLYVVLGELLPEAILMWRSKLPAFLTLVGILTGMIIIYL